MIKLRNKKTREIAEFMVHKRIEDSKDGNPVYAPFIINPEEWEDVPEPKPGYTIDSLDEDCVSADDESGYEISDIERAKELGIWFETKEEAQKAVEKLKAWKRLKDKGFEFCCDIEYEDLCGNGFNIPLKATMPPEAYTDIEVGKDLELLFGQEGEQ